MTPNEYIALAGEYCERMEWNHDAIPELAKCLESHDQRVSYQVFELRDEVLACNMKLIHDNEKLREKVKNQTHRLRFLEGATNHAGGFKQRENVSQTISDGSTWLDKAGPITFSAEI